jgi:hypothetical protein
MDAPQDEIVDIPPHRVKYFGTTGKMLLPCPATIQAVINTIPADKLITTDLLRKKLTEEFNVEGTCPVTTKKALQTLANVSGADVPYWRVINQNGGLMSGFPGGTAHQAELLQEAGFALDTHGKSRRVDHYKDKLASFS